jgi:tyrosine-protein kinase Etk/Wzc
MQQDIGQEENFDINKIFNKVILKWHWFLISTILCLVVAFLYTKYKAPTYQIGARLLVKDDEKGGGLGKQAGALMDLGGILGSSNSVDNEAEVLKTRFLMEQVVRELQLNLVYSSKDGFKIRELDKSPFKLSFVNAVDTIEETSIEFKKLSNGKILVKSDDYKGEVSIGQTFKIKDVGTVKIEVIPYVKFPVGDYLINVCSIDSRVNELMKQLYVAVSNKQVTVIDLGLTFPLQKRGEEVLNTLISKYTEANLGDKNSIADSTYKFIRDRINVIASELGDVENQVESFKESNKLADMSEQSKMLVQNTGDYTTELAKAETQVTVMNDLENYLQDEAKNKRVFPTSLLPQDLVFSNLMTQYNGLLIEREKQLLSVTEGSPFIQNIDGQIAGLRSGILANIRSSKNTYVVTRNKLRSQLNKVEDQIGGVPQIEKNYLKLARNQKIKQELYIFLMQKAEETAISKSANISVAKIIDPPKADFKPISPKKSVAFAGGLVFGLILPLIFIFSQEVLNTKISTKEDITALTLVPVLGEISHNLSNDNLIVANQGRSAISEQFRALRTNLMFYLKSEQEKVILLTSSMSGEGKSFTAINIGIILALSGKKVLLMELDLRKPGLSSKLLLKNQLGFSNYVINDALKVSDIITPLSFNSNMFIIPSGPLPPNPAETLLSSRTAELITDLKKEFDYIILDAPPIGIITDAQLLSHFADVTLYLVRQNVTQKKQISIVQDLYNQKKMPNIGIVVNDITSKEYGYGYGYGNYGQEEESKYQRFVKRFKG